jgi:hypothetical protein
MLKHIAKYSLMLIIACASNMYAQQQCYDVGSVVTDSPAYTFDTQFRALFLKPGATNLYYAAEAFPFNDNIATPIVSPHWKIYDLHPDYHFGFDVGLACVLHERHSTLSANWEHFNSCTSATTPAVSTEQYPAPMVGPFSSIGPDSADYNILAHGRVNFRFNELNIRYGQYIEVGDYLKTNIFAGITFADIKQCLQSLYIGTGDISQIITVPSSFIGAGPQVGIDFAYEIVDGFCFTGQFTGALLMGRVKNHTSYASSSPLLEALGDPSPNLQSTSVQNKMQMVPGLSERLAFAYFLSFCDCYRAKLEVGFEAKMFLNAFESTNLASGVIDVAPYDNTVGVFARTFERTVSSFSLSGPYIALNMAF